MKHSWRANKGFTMIEVLIAMTLTSMISGVVLMGLLTSTRVAQITTDQINDSADAALASAFLIRDAQSSGGTNPITALGEATSGVSLVDWSGCQGTLSDASLRVRFETAANGTVVTYALEGGQLIRTSCETGKDASQIILGRNLATVEATCKPILNCSGHPTGVSLKLTGANSVTPLRYTLSAALRSIISQMAIVAPATLADGQINTPYPPTVMATFGAASPSVWSATGLPAGMKLNTGNGTISETPTVGGPFTVVISVTDALAVTVSRTYSLNVLVPPVAADDSYTTLEDTTLNIGAPGVLANDSNPKNQPRTAVLVVGTAGLTLNNDGSFRYSPPANFNGPASFTYSANYGTLASNTATVTLNVTAVNDAPVAAADNYTVIEHTTLNIPTPGVLGNDSDADSNPLTAVLVTTTAHGTLVLSANGAFTYTHAAGFSGVDTFTYKANDGIVNSNTVVATLTVTGVNDPPVANPNSYTTLEDNTLNILAGGVLTNDTDPEGDSLNAILITGVTHGTVTLAGNGGFIYSPTANFNGTDTFTYKANDGALNSNTATVTLTVTSVNDAPSFTKGGDQQTRSGTAQSVTGWATNISAGGTDVGQTLNFIVTNDNNAIFTSQPAIAANGTLNYSAKAGMTGTAIVSVRLHDDGGVANGGVDTSAIQTFTIRIKVSYATLILATPGLTGYWRLGEAVLPTVIDSKGSNNGTYSGPTVGAGGAIVGDPNTAAQFDGINDYATVTPTIGSDISVEFWFKSTQGIGTSNDWKLGAGLVSANVNPAKSFGASLRSDGRVVVGVGDNGTGDSAVSANGGYNNGAWHFVVLARTKSGGNVKLYVDGVLGGTVGGAHGDPGNGNITFNFGRMAATSNLYYQGSLDEIALYSVALDQATVAAHYNAGM